MKEDIMVTVLCTAYNHKDYIEDAMKGVLNQKTNFKYELLIHDDASTDGTAEIIQEYEQKYPQLIRIIMQKKNQFQHCRIYPTFLFPEVRGKYVAFCEGDDYWTDEMKLQKQIDFLETHKEYSMCIHNAVKLNVETGEESYLNTFPEDGTYSQEEQIKAGLGTDFPAFASYVARAKLLQKIAPFFLESNVIDYPLRQFFANQGKIYYFHKPMSVYRVATPQSYMKKTTKSQTFYNNYTLEMIHFFEEFDKYTEKKFHSLLERKMISDYLGFCCSVDMEQGLVKAEKKGLDMRKIRSCYQCLSPEYLSADIKKLLEKSDGLFIYGISRLSEICRRQLNHAQVKYQGFVVSDGQMKPENIEGESVFYLSEIIENYDNPGFILAVQPVNVNVIARNLKGRKMDNYCMPYLG